jgi:hypothetical protein
MDRAGNDLYSLKQTTQPGKLMSVLFNTEEHLEDRDGLYDITTSDVNYVVDQLMLMTARVPQDYYAANSAMSRQSSKVAYGPDSVISKSLSPGGKGSFMMNPSKGFFGIPSGVLSINGDIPPPPNFSSKAIPSINNFRSSGVLSSGNLRNYLSPTPTTAPIQYQFPLGPSAPQFYPPSSALSPLPPLHPSRFSFGGRGSNAMIPPPPMNMKLSTGVSTGLGGSTIFHGQPASNTSLPPPIGPINYSGPSPLVGLSRNSSILNAGAPAPPTTPARNGASINLGITSSI